MEAAWKSQLSVHRHLVIVGAALAMLTALVLLRESAQLLVVGYAATLCVVLFAYKLDYLHPAVAYLVPWLTILFFSTVPISKYAHSLELPTGRTLLAAMLAWLASTTLAPVVSAADEVVRERPRLEVRPGFGNAIIMAFMILYGFAALNVAVSGYVPLISLITSGDSGYAYFGIPSVYGAFLAYANALGCLVFYAWLCGRRRIYLLLFLSIVVMHIAFVTRQNVITLLAEAFVIRSLTIRRTSRLTIVGIVAVGLLGFSLLGELRSGDINEVIGVEPEYSWIPTSLIWLYAYSYFNVLNLNNMILQSGAPLFNGVMWQSLLPSVLRGDPDPGTYLELSTMTVSSYIYPVYMDVGGVGVVIVTALFGYVTTLVYRQALRRRRFVDVATYACLFYCALLCFFSNFWLYLPVIFQLFFFRAFHFLLFIPSAGPAGRSSLVMGARQLSQSQP
jgi:oligosaccharide repeat unit polymerase